MLWRWWKNCKYTVQGEVAVTSPVFFSYIGVEEVYHGSLSFCGAVCHAGPASGPCAEQRRHPRQCPACAVRVDDADYDVAQQRLQQAHLKPERVLRHSGAGYSEVAV